MHRHLWAAIAAWAMACSGADPDPAGSVVVAVTIDWEGAYLSPEGLEAITAMRAQLGDVPVTHFVSAAYFTKASPDPAAASTIAAAVRPGDELAVHVHGWRSLAEAAGVAPRLSPSFFTGTDELTDLQDGDLGFDLDLDAYDATAQRALLRTSRALLAKTGRPVSTAFRAGGYVCSPRLRQALRDEGFAIDSSALDHRQLGDGVGAAFHERLAELWPDVAPATQPWSLALRGGELLELPIAAVADYVEADALAQIIAQAQQARAADPARDVIVVVALHQETAAEFAARITGGLRASRDSLRFVTITEAGARARRGLAQGRQ